MLFSARKSPKSAAVLSVLLKVYKREKSPFAFVFAFFYNRRKTHKAFLFALHNFEKILTKKIYFQRKKVTNQVAVLSVFFGIIIEKRRQALARALQKKRISLKLQVFLISILTIPLIYDKISTLQI